MNRLIAEAPDVQVVTWQAPDLGSGRVVWSTGNQMGYVDVLSLHPDYVPSLDAYDASVTDAAAASLIRVGRLDLHCFMRDRYVARLLPVEPVEQPRRFMLRDGRTGAVVLDVPLDGSSPFPRR